LKNGAETFSQKESQNKMDVESAVVASQLQASSHNSGSNINDGNGSASARLKKPQSAFIIFSSELRKQLAQQQTKLSFKDTAATIAEKYKALTVDEKQKYDDLARLEKERYLRERELFGDQTATAVVKTPVNSCVLPLVGIRHLWYDGVRFVETYFRRLR
jgi:hypothetical protein